MNTAKLIGRLSAGMLVVWLGLFANTGTGHAAVMVWTNTAGGYWDDPLSWSPNTVPGPADDGTFNAAATYTVTITNDTVANSIDNANAANTTQTLTLDLTGHSLSLLKGGTGQPTVWTIADAGSSTAIVYLVSSTGVGRLYCTNGAPRFTVGRSGIGTFYVTNSTVTIVGSAILANGSSGRGTLVLTGPDTYWTNSSSFNIGNQMSSIGCSLVISNSASMTVQSTFGVGGAGSSSHSLLLDTGGRLFTANAGTVTIGNSSGSNNTAVVRNGASWDNANRLLSIGGTGAGNSLTVGTTASVVNVSILNIASGNTLSLSGGLLRVSLAVTNNSGTITGFGTIVGNTFVLSGSQLTPGLGTSVGTMTFSNDLTLVTGATTTIKLDKGQAGSNDLLNIVGTLNEGGTLTINNVGAALVGGDTFKILAFGSESGNFVFTNLPALGGGLLWNTTQLNSQGAISVVLPPSITGPAGQAVTVGSNVTISTTVTGVPLPGLQWQKDGVNVTDGPTGNGSTNSGSTTATLMVSNAQTNGSGNYCLIASNFAGSVTNCMTLTVSLGNSCPTIGGPTDQNVILGSNATFTASVAGIPTPTQQWYENGNPITDATNTSVTIVGVNFGQDGNTYCIIATNNDCSATNCAVLHVVVPPAIQVCPVSLVITDTQTACFSVTSTNGVPPPTYQWKFNNVDITGATNSTYCISNASPANAGNYSVVVANVAGSAACSNAFLTVNSTMTASPTPSNNATGVCYDTPLYLAFDRAPISNATGKIKIFISTNSVTPVDTIDTGLGNLQARTIGTETFNTFPVITTSNTAVVYPHLGVLTSNQTYYVTVDPGTFAETNGALFAGITDTNAWRFTTKPTGPANPNSVVVAADGSGDFCTVQGAVDFVPLNNGTLRLINIRDGTYTELIDTRAKSNITFRGQSRSGTIIRYRNNDSQNPGTHARMSFKVFGNDTAIENLTLMNTTPQGGSQAEALMIETAVRRLILNNAEVDSRQDTILVNVNSSQGYFNNSLVQGNFDYIWGGGNCFFTNCEIRTIPTANNYNVVATRTDAGATGNWPSIAGGAFVSNGFSFVNCQLTRSDTSITNITLAGSNGTPGGNAVWINCNIDTNCYRAPSAAVTNSENLWEYGNSNLDNTASATFGLVVLTNGDARLTCALDPTCWLSGWVPQLAINILSGPTNLTVNFGQPAAFSVSATGISDPTYQWLKAGTNLVGQTSATLSIPATVADDAGTYSVIVSNSAGAVTNSATLTVIPTPFEAWQQSYFGCTSCPQAAANADPDGDGLTNQAEFLAGTDPTSAASGLRITSTAKQGNNVVIVWTTAGGRTNVVQATAGVGNGGYSTNFTDLSGQIIIGGSGDMSTNYTDVGGATNVPARYYRIRLVP